MPKLPMTIASGEVPSRIPAGQASPGEFGVVGRAISGLGEEIGETSQQWGIVRQKLQQERNEMEAISITTEYDNRLNQIRLAVKQESDPLSHEFLFAEQAQRAEQELSLSTKSDVVRSVLAKHAMRKFTGELALVRSEALELFNNGQKAWLDRQEEDLSKRAAEGDEFARREAQTTYEGLLTRFDQRGIIKSTDVQTRRKSFQQKTLEKQMNVLRLTDRARLREMQASGAFADLELDKQLKILEAARKDEEREQSTQDRNFLEAKKAVDWVWSGKASMGELLTADIEAAKKGKNPYISPDRARELERVNNTAPTTEADLAVAEIAQRYYGGPRTQARIMKFRGEINALLSSFQKPSRSGATFLNELQSDEFAVESLDVQRESAGIREVKDRLRSQPSTAPPIGIIKSMDDNLRKAEEAEASTRVRRGEKAADVARDIEERRKKIRESIPESDRSLMRLVE